MVLVPIGLGVVKLEDSISPVEVSHVRPVILVEAGGALEHLLVDVQDELFFNSSTLRALQGMANSLSPMPRNPPKDRTA